MAGTSALTVRAILRRRDLGTPAERATFTTPAPASQAAPHLREGPPHGRPPRGRHLRALLDARAVALVAGDALLAWDGGGAGTGTGAGGPTCRGGPAQRPPERPRQRGRRLRRRDLPDRGARPVPVTEEERVVGALVAYGTDTSAGLVRGHRGGARWVSTQVDLAGLDRSRRRAMEAELRALRAQSARTSSTTPWRRSPASSAPIPSAPASCCWSSPTSPGTPSGGAGSSPRWPTGCQRRALPRARAGPVRRPAAGELVVAPEVLGVAVPFLAVQPLVENAVRHGLEGKPGVGPSPWPPGTPAARR